MFACGVENFSIFDLVTPSKLNPRLIILIFTQNCARTKCVLVFSVNK